jgi:predicted nicotinamide N-methyase
MITPPDSPCSNRSISSSHAGRLTFGFHADRPGSIKILPARSPRSASMDDVLNDASRAGFIATSTRIAPVALVPEIRLHLAEDPFRMWETTERALGRTGLPPPFWAFAWAGGQALARYLLDHPDVVRGRRVIDIATGSGLVAIAAAMAGAAAVTATDIDPLAVTTARLNAEVNDVRVAVWYGDVLDGDGAVFGQQLPQVALAADAFYEKDLAQRVMRFLERARSRDAAVLAGDLGRRFLPRSRLREVAAYDVPVSTALEGTEVKRTAVWQPA